MPKTDIPNIPSERSTKESALAAIARIRRMKPRGSVPGQVFESDVKLIERFIQENGQPTTLEVGALLANAADDVFEQGVTVTDPEPGRHGETEFEIQLPGGAVYVVTIEEAE
jgi:hypothetical protein